LGRAEICGIQKFKPASIAYAFELTLNSTKHAANFAVGRFRSNQPRYILEQNETRLEFVGKPNKFMKQSSARVLESAHATGRAKGLARWPARQNIWTP